MKSTQINDLMRLVDYGYIIIVEHSLFIMNRLNLRVRSGELVAVVGATGSGKSSLLSAIIGQMSKVQGTVNVNVSILIVQIEIDIL